MLGAIAGSGLLPFSREQFEAVIRESGRGADASLRGFARAWDAVKGIDAPPTARDSSPTGEASATWLDAPDIDAAFPATTREFVRLGFDRMIAFQDRAYADLYLSRLRPILAAETARDPETSPAITH